MRTNKDLIAALLSEAKDAPAGYDGILREAAAALSAADAQLSKCRDRPNIHQVASMVMASAAGEPDAGGFFAADKVAHTAKWMASVSYTLADALVREGKKWEGA